MQLAGRCFCTEIERMLVWERGAVNGHVSRPARVVISHARWELLDAFGLARALCLDTGWHLMGLWFFSVSARVCVQQCVVCIR